MNTKHSKHSKDTNQKRTTNNALAVLINILCTEIYSYTDKQVVRPRMFDVLENGARLYLSENKTNAFNTDCRLWNPFTEPNLQNQSDDTFTFDSFLNDHRVQVYKEYWANVEPELRNRTIPGNFRNCVNIIVFAFLLCLFFSVEQVCAQSAP